MKKFLMILVALFMGCGNYPSPDQKFEALNRPVIVVAISKWNDVVVRGSDSVYVTIPCDYYLARSIGNSYEIGDTLK